LKKLCSLLFSLFLLLSIPVTGQERLSRSDSQEPAQSEPQDQVKVFTEEVRLPLLALDQFGHYDPTLELNDILVLEDGVPQEVRSIRHMPNSVLLLLDTGIESSGLGGVSKSTYTTRQAAKHVLAMLPKGDSVAVMQFNSKIELLQDWTTEKAAVARTLDRKLYPGRRVRFSDALVAAAEVMKDRPEGSRHIVLISDGVDSEGVKTGREEATRRLIDARASLHIISYTELVRQEAHRKKESVLANQQSSARAIANAGIDPTLPPGMTRGTIGMSSGVGIRFDPAMKRRRKAYEAEVMKSQQGLTTLAEETGGQIALPNSEDDLILEGDRVARDIGAYYVITYRPKRPLAEAAAGEYRRIEVAPRKSGLVLRTRRGYVAKSAE
jgi:VWFA-related protein